MRNRLPAMLLVGVLISTLAAQTATYDAFMQLNVEQRHAQFKTFTPEQRADLVRTHLQRYLAKNRPRLTADQTKFLEETSKVMSADFYRQPMTVEMRQKVFDIDQRGRELFEPKEGRQVLTLDGDYIPPVQ
jgi:hypothetical protein